MDGVSGLGMDRRGFSGRRCAKELTNACVDMLLSGAIYPHSDAFLEAGSVGDAGNGANTIR
jgi:hypothetical protein